MINPVQPSSQAQGIKDADEEGGFLPKDLVTKKSSKHIKTLKSQKSPIFSRQQIFIIVAALFTIIGIGIAYVWVGCDQQSDPILSAQREKIAVMKVKMADKEKIIDQLLLDQQRLTNQLNERHVSESKEVSLGLEGEKVAGLPENQGGRWGVDVVYTAKEFGTLPIDPLRKNAQGQRVAEALYKDESIRKQREGFMRQRTDFVDAQSNFPSIFLAKYNLINTEEQLKRAVDENKKVWERLQGKFQLSKLKEELPMCLIVPGYNNNANFRIEYNLNSIFTQNYTNYKAVIINDASTDGSDQIYRNYFNFYAIDKQRYTYIENTKKENALHNTYLASTKICSKDSIILSLDGDDELIGRNVMQVFNWAYQNKKAGVIYSNFISFQQPHQIRLGWTSEYPQDVKKNNLFRSTIMKFSHFRSFKNELIFQIDPKDLKDQKGDFFAMTSDFALIIPLMQLSCGRVHKIEGEFHYLYNVGTGLNDDTIDLQKQTDVVSRVIKQKKYECFKEFDQRMKK